MTGAFNRTGKVFWRGVINGRRRLFAANSRTEMAWMIRDTRAKETKWQRCR